MQRLAASDVPHLPLAVFAVTEPSYLMLGIYAPFGKQAPALEATQRFRLWRQFLLLLFHIKFVPAPLMFTGASNANRLPFGVFDQMVAHVCSSVSGV